MAVDNEKIKAALNEGEVAIAKELFTNLDKSQKISFSGRLLTSRILFRENRIEESYDLLEQLIAEQKDNADAHYYFGRSAVVMAQQVSLFSKLSYANSGLEAWQQALSLNPEHIKTLEGIIGFHIGAPSIAGGDIEKALSYSQILVKLDPEKGYANLARVYWQKEQHDLAEKTITDGLNSLPNSSPLYLTQGLAYIRQAQDNGELWTKARMSLNNAVTHAKSTKEKQHALYQLGKVAVNSGEETQAGIEALEQLLALKTEQYQQWGRYRLAELYLNTNQFDKANIHITQVDYQEDDTLEDEVKGLAKKIRKAIKKHRKNKAS
ncbi:MAG: hypothetical protein QF552_07015 [Litorilituus sp.]|jgi:tetratricopeptide (TPR) repeat protein|nr:hypothetical protein [Litorilituus sp.]